MLVAARADLGPSERAVLATAGSFAAIASLFGGPLPAAVLMVEASIGAGLGAAVIPLLLPGLVAAGIGYLVFAGFGDFSGLEDVVPDSTAGKLIGTVVMLNGIALLTVITAAVTATLIDHVRSRTEVDQREGRPPDPALGRSLEEISSRLDAIEASIAASRRDRG